MKLSKAQEKTRAALVSELAAAGKLVEHRFAELLSFCRRAADDANEAIALYNAALVKSARFATELAEEFRGEFDEKSESWKDGERGQEADSFIAEWESFDASTLPTVHIIEPELEEKPCHAETLDALPADSN